MICKGIYIKKMFDDILDFFLGGGGWKEMRTVVTPSPTLNSPVGLDSPENLISLQTQDVDRMLGQRRRQWANIKPMFSFCIVFAWNLFP